MSENNSSRTPEAQDQISLIDVLIIILKHKWLIITIMVVSIAISIFYTYNQSTPAPAPATAPQDTVDVYYSRCIIEVDTSVPNKVKALLMSHKIAESISKSAKLHNINYKILDEKTQQDLQSLEYNKAGVIPDFLINAKNPNEIRPTLTFISKDNIFEIGFFSNDADIPQKILNAYLYQLNDYLRKQNIEIIDSQKKADQLMLENARDPILKQNLYRDMISLSKREMEIKNSKLYGFYVIDPPITTNKIIVKKAFINNQSKPIDKPAGQISAEGQERMKKRKIVIPVIIMSFFLAVMLAFFIEYLKNMKMNNPEKFQALRDYARFRIK